MQASIPFVASLWVTAKIRCFDFVEDPGRFFDHNHAIRELAVHAIKS